MNSNDNHVPGVPSVTHMRVIDEVVSSNSSNIMSDSKYVWLADQSSIKFEVGKLLEKNVSDQELLTNTIGDNGKGGTILNPISAYVNDAVTTVILIIGSRRTMKSQFLKRFFLPHIAKELFVIIANKIETSPELQEVTMKLCGFEIVDEVLTDLLRPSMRGFAISNSLHQGIHVAGLSEVKISTESSLKKMLEDMCANRGAHPLPPGATLDSSSAVWELQLFQKEGPKGHVATAASRLLIVDVPSVDSMIPNKAVSTLESPNIHKSAVTFMDVIKKLSNPATKHIAPFRNSKLTHYLSELLGGNSLVLGLAIVQDNEVVESRYTLELTDALSHCYHYPIAGHEISEIVEGLLDKYRGMILQLQDEVESARATSSLSTSGHSYDTGHDLEQHQATIHALELKVSLVQQELAGCISERNVSRQDAARLFEVMELLKSKYNTLLESKMQQTEQLIQSEEERLLLAKAVVSGKLELSEAQEAIEKDRFLLSTAALSAKAEAAESLHQMNTLKAAKEDLEAKLQAQKDLVTASKAALQEVKRQLDKESDRNLDIGAELLTLVNQREVLQRRVTEAENLATDLTSKLQSAQELVSADGLAVSALRGEVKGLREEALKSTREKIEAELSLKALKIEFEKSKLDFDKMAAEFLRDRDETFQKSKRSTENEIQILKENQEDYIQQIRRSQRLLLEKDRELKRLRSDLEESMHEKSIVDEQLNSNRLLFRTKLATIISESSQALQESDSVSANPLLKNKLSKVMDAFSAKKPMDLVQEMVGTYVDAEKQLKRTNQLLAAKCETYKAAYRLLYGKYAETLSIISDSIPSMMPKETLAEDYALQLASSSTSKTMESSDGDDNDIVTLRAKLGQLQESFMVEQSKAAVAIASYRKKFDAASDEIVRLKEEIKLLKERTSHLATDVEKSRKLEDIEKAMVKEIEDVKGKQDAELQKRPLQVMAMRAQKQLEEENAELKRRLLERENEFARQLDACKVTLRQQLSEEAEKSETALRSVRRLEAEVGMLRGKLDAVDSEAGDTSALPSVSGVSPGTQSEEAEVIAELKRKVQAQQEELAVMAAAGLAKEDTLRLLQAKVSKLEAEAKAVASTAIVPSPESTMVATTSAEVELLRVKVKDQDGEISSLKGQISAAILNAQNDAAQLSALASMRQEREILLQRVKQLEAELEALKLAASQTSVGPGSADVSKMSSLEQRCAQLMSKNAALEEELSGYKKYMKDTVVQYKTQVKSLQTKLQKASGSGAAAASSDG